MTKTNKINMLIILTIFSISFRIFSLSILLSSICLYLFLQKNNFNRSNISSYILIFSFYIFHYAIGITNEADTVYFTLKTLLFFITSSFFYFLAIIDQNKIKKHLIYFSIFSLTYAFTISIYSYINNYRGYNDLYNPFEMVQTNSPLVATLISISLIILLECLNLSKKNITFIIILFIISTLISTIYLGSRASLILIFLYVFMKTLMFILNRVSIKTLTLILIFISIFIFMIMNINLLNFGGFYERGLESSRFTIIKDGLYSLLDHPFGGMKVVSASWFHNIFLDIARVSGYIVTLFWCIILTFILTIIIANKFIYKTKKTFGILFFILMLSFSQDLAFDGYYNTMALLFMIMGYNVNIFFNKKRDDNESFGNNHNSK
ncbi:hypothetical protein DMB99_09710 [Proteus mirabilis]|nr:hypothetical protein AM405_11135 [Proteus mirabilis]PXA27081.1 hypothetical protein DMB99_09710 [Proteus mirabilis]